MTPVEEGGVYAGGAPIEEVEELVPSVDEGRVYAGGAPMEEVEELAPPVEDEGGVYAGGGPSEAEDTVDRLVALTTVFVEEEPPYGGGRPGSTTIAALTAPATRVVPRTSLSKVHSKRM